MAVEAAALFHDAPWVLSGHKKWLNGVLVSPCGSQVFSFGQDGRVCCFSGTSHALQYSLKGRTAVHAVAVSAAGLLFSSGDEGELLAWQPGEAGWASPTHALRGHTGVVRCLVLSKDSLWSAGSGDCVVQRWALGALHPPPDVSAAPLSLPPSCSLEGHTGPVGHLQLARQGATLVSASSDGTVRAWCTLSNACLALFAAAVRSPVTSMAADGDSLHVGCEDGAWRLWGIPEAADADDAHPTPVQPPCLAELASAGAPVTCLLLDVGRAHAFGGLASGALSAWRTGPSSQALPLQLWHVADAHGTACISALATTPCGASLLSCGYDGDVKQWSAHAGALLRVMRDGSWHYRALAVSSDGAMLYAASTDRHLRAWPLLPTRSVLVDAARAVQSGAAGLGATLAARVAHVLAVVDRLNSSGRHADPGPVVLSAAPEPYQQAMRGCSDLGLAQLERDAAAELAALEAAAGLVLEGWAAQAAAAGAAATGAAHSGLLRDADSGSESEEDVAPLEGGEAWPPPLPPSAEQTLAQAFATLRAGAAAAAAAVAAVAAVRQGMSPGRPREEAMAELLPGPALTVEGELAWEPTTYAGEMSPGLSRSTSLARSVEEESASISTLRANLATLSAFLLPPGSSSEANLGALAEVSL